MATKMMVALFLVHLAAPVEAVRYTSEALAEAVAEAQKDLDVKKQKEVTMVDVMADGQNFKKIDVEAGAKKTVPFTDCPSTSPCMKRVMPMLPGLRHKRTCFCDSVCATSWGQQGVGGEWCHVTRGPNHCAGVNIESSAASTFGGKPWASCEKSLAKPQNQKFVCDTGDGYQECEPEPEVNRLADAQEAAKIALQAAKEQADDLYTVAEPKLAAAKEELVKMKAALAVAAAAAVNDAAAAADEAYLEVQQEAAKAYKAARESFEEEMTKAKKGTSDMLVAAKAEADQVMTRANAKMTEANAALSAATGLAIAAATNVSQKAADAAAAWMAHRALCKGCRMHAQPMATRSDKSAIKKHANAASKERGEECTRQAGQPWCLDELRDGEIGMYTKGEMSGKKKPATVSWKEVCFCDSGCGNSVMDGQGGKPWCRVHEQSCGTPAENKQVKPKGSFGGGSWMPCLNAIKGKEKKYHSQMLREIADDAGNFEAYEMCDAECI